MKILVVILPIFLNVNNLMLGIFRFYVLNTEYIYEYL